MKSEGKSAENLEMNNKFSFQKTVQSLARVLARIKPTPWPKVARPHIKINNLFCSTHTSAFHHHRYKHCTVIVHKKMQPEFFVWIVVPKMLSSLLDCTSWKVVANTNNKSFLICFGWPKLCPRPCGLMIVLSTKRTVN